MSGYLELKRCRVCGNERLEPVLSLGRQHLTGVFPKSRAQRVTAGPLELVKCHGRDACQLLQLRHSYRNEEMYRDYGYHSGLNPSMVAHLQDTVRRLLTWVELRRGDVVLDIGSNDATLLKAYPARGLVRVGMDPTGQQFRRFYPKDALLIPDYFSSAGFRARLGDRKAAAVTSIAMFYDLEAPLEFMRQVREALAPEGVWVVEQNYLPTMLAVNAYDSVCHEHLEYYGLRQLHWMAERSGLKIIDARLNRVNGGSVAASLVHVGSARRASTRVARLLAAEAPLAGLAPYRAFRRRVLEHRDRLRAFLEAARRRGQVVLGYGASTKGNVLLQFCGVTERELPRIGEVNADKFGRFTPGTLIPIVPEAEVRRARPDYLLVLPWHFRDFILKKEAAYRRAGGKLLFPLPSVSAL